MKKIIISLLFSILVLSSAWAQAAKVVTGVESGERIIETNSTVETESYTLESVGSVTITSGQSITIKPGTHIKEGSDFEGIVSDTIVAEVDEMDNTDDFEAPHKQPLNTRPLNIQPFDPMAGINGILTPTPNNYGTVELSYPLWVPEGINGMTPDIGLSYSSEVKNGNCGYGWNFSTSKIVIDSRMEIPGYDDNDNYLFDGQELVKVGANEYRFKQEGSFVRIEFINKYEGFRVYYTDGSVAKYGNTMASRLEGLVDSRSGCTFAWCITEVADRFGNKVTYEYEEVFENGDRVNLRLKTIKYAYVNDQPSYSVDLTWRDGDEARYSYKAGFPIKYGNKIEQIDIKSHITGSEELLRSYDLAYGNGAFGVEILEIINEKSPSGSILNSMTLVYNEDETVTFGGETEWSFGINTQLVDVNGDGLPDKVSKSNSAVSVTINHGTGFHSGSNWLLDTAGSHQCDAATLTFKDFNNDGKTDFKARCSHGLGHGHGFGNIDYYMSTGDEFVVKPVDFNLSASEIPVSEFYNEKGIDFNGDGASDTFVINTSPYSGTTLRVSLNTGNSTSINPEWNIQFDDPVTFFDITGDGLPDAVTVDKSSYPYPVYFQKNTGAGFESIRHKIHSGTGSSGTYLTDLNGDNIGDLVRKGVSQSYVRLGEKVYRHRLQAVINNKTQVQTTFEYEDILVHEMDSRRLYNTQTVLSSYTTGNDELSFTTRIGYKNGITDAYEHEFRGFTQITTEYDDSDEDVTYITETYYDSERCIFIDEFDNKKYDPYINGEITKVVDKYQIAANNPVTTSEIQYDYTHVPILDNHSQYQRGQVRFMYLFHSLNKVYTDGGDFLGQNENFTHYQFNQTTGLFTLQIKNAYGDSLHALDDATVNIYYTSNVSSRNWIHGPYKSEVFWDHSDTLIGQTNMYYDNLPLGSIGSGSVSRMEQWNNNGADLGADYTYDTYGNISSITNEAGLTTTVTTEYLQNGDFAVVTNTSPLNLGSKSYINSYGEVREHISAQDEVVKYYYDNYGRIVKVDVPEVNATHPVIEVEYGVDNYIESAYSQWGGTTSNEVVALFYAKAKYLDDSEDGYYNVHYFKDKLGRDGQTRYEAEVGGAHGWLVAGKKYYDSMGRIIKTGDITGMHYDDLTKTSYGDTGYLEPEAYTYYTYDKLGRIKQVSLPGGKKYIEYLYNKSIDTNYLPFAIGAGGSYSRMLNRIQVASFDRTNLTYGFPTLINYETVFRDMSGRIVKTESRDGDATPVQSFTDYSPAGLVRSKDPYGKITEVSYDSLGRRKHIITPDAGKTEYLYNSVGRLGSVREYGRDDSNYRSIYYNYDDFGRISNVNYPGGYENDIWYDYFGTGPEVGPLNRGQVSRIRKGATEHRWGSTTWLSYHFEKLMSYDHFTVNETKRFAGKSYLTTYEMDVQGRIKNITTPDGEDVSYHYNNGGLLERITGTKNDNGMIRNDVYVDSILYNKYGQRDYTRFGNGSEMNYKYDPYTHLLDKYTVDKDDFNILEYNYTFSVSGGLTDVAGSFSNAQSSFNQSYAYDVQNRLVSSNGNYHAADPGDDSSYVRTYVYDDLNRIRKKTFSNGDYQVFNYSASSHEIKIIDNFDTFNNHTGRSQLYYDDYGNMVSKYYIPGTSQSPSRFTSYRYDQANKMVEFKEGLREVDFTYDHAGQRTTKVSRDNGTVISSARYINGFYTEKDGRAAVHISDGKDIVASKLVENQDRKVFYHQNHLGSTALITNHNGGKVQNFLYHPYGEMWVVDNGPSVFAYDGDDQELDVNVNKLFTGQIYDKETGLYYYNARYYDPDLGTFLRPDPAMDGYNHYSYCNGNPVMFTDPTGLTAESSGDGGDNGGEASTAKSTGNKSQGGEKKEGTGGSEKGGDNSAAGLQGGVLSETKSKKKVHHYDGSPEQLYSQVGGKGAVTVISSSEAGTSYTYNSSGGSDTGNGGESGGHNGGGNDAGPAPKSRPSPVKGTSAEGRSNSRSKAKSRKSYMNKGLHIYEGDDGTLTVVEKVREWKVVDTDEKVRMETRRTKVVLNMTNRFVWNLCSRIIGYITDYAPEFGPIGLDPLGLFYDVYYRDYVVTTEYEFIAEFITEYVNGEPTENSFPTGDVRRRKKVPHYEEDMAYYVTEWHFGPLAPMVNGPIE